MTKAGNKDFHKSALESPWAAWIAEKVKGELEQRTRTVLNERLSSVAAEKAQEDSELWRQKTEELVAQLRSEMDGVKEISAAEQKGKAEFEAATDQNAREEQGLEFEVDDLQDKKERLLLMIESDRRRREAERATLERRLAEDAEEGARALRIREDEAAVLRDHLDFLQNEHAKLPQHILDNLQQAWDSLAPEWGLEFKKAIEVCKRELRHFNNEADFKVARERLSRNFRAYQENNAILGSPDAVMHAECPQPNAGPGERIHIRADQDAPTEEISEARRRVLCALLANDVLLSRIHQRQLLQRTHRTQRTREELDVTWWKGAAERPAAGTGSARRGCLAGALRSSLSAQRGNSTWR
jgi:hypothetical protein